MTTLLTRRRAARAWMPAVGALAAAALAVAGCGGSTSGGQSSGGGQSSAASQSSGAYGAYGGTASKPTPAAGGASVGVASSKLGRILVDGQGRTLYLFKADKGPSSTCTGTCAQAWPPLLTKGKPVAMSGLSPAKLGMTKRSDGTSEVTYNGHPLYRYIGDTAAGQTSGEEIHDFGAEWDVLSRAGTAVTTDDK